MATILVLPIHAQALCEPGAGLMNLVGNIAWENVLPIKVGGEAAVPVIRESREYLTERYAHWKEDARLNPSHTACTG